MVRKKQNRRLKQHQSRRKHPELITTEIEDVTIFFEAGKFRKSNVTRNEDRAITAWKFSLLMTSAFLSN